jgi:hypothetical protein
MVTVTGENVMLTLVTLVVVAYENASPPSATAKKKRWGFYGISPSLVFTENSFAVRITPTSANGIGSIG